MFTKSLLTGAILGASILPLVAQDPATAIQGQLTSDFPFNIPPTVHMQDELGVALDAGTDAVGDGDVLQFGYFSGIGVGTDVTSFGQNEWDSFTPLTSAGGRHVTTIGDSGGISGNLGIFTISLNLDPALDPELPAGGFPLRIGIRFYNDTSIGTSSHFNVVTSNETSWRLFGPSVPPPTPPAFMDMDDPATTLTWQSGAGGAFQTALVMLPEPSSVLLVLLGALSFGLRRRR